MLLIGVSLTSFTLQPSILFKCSLKMAQSWSQIFWWTRQQSWTKTQRLHIHMVTLLGSYGPLFPLGSASIISVKFDSGVSHRLVMIDIKSQGLLSIQLKVIDTYTHWLQTLYNFIPASSPCRFWCIHNMNKLCHLIFPYLLTCTMAPKRRRKGCKDVAQCKLGECLDVYLCACDVHVC